jgi:hypothetical protein
MAIVTFEEPDKTTDKSFYERMERKAISKITPLTCPTHKEAHAHISIRASSGRFSFDIVHACCSEFKELVEKAVYPFAE